MPATLTASQLKVKIFADGAGRDTMLELLKNPLVQGFTTNPSLMKSAGVKDYVGFCKEILQQIPKHPISFEVFADEISEMRRQAQIIKTWGPNVYVKIPVTNSEGRSTSELIRELSREGVKLNVTAIFTLKQTLEVCEALRGGAPSVVSVFAGRIADTGYDPEPLMRSAREVCDTAGPQCELLWASSREPLNIAQADRTGCHIITCTPELIKKVSIFGKDLTEFSLDTVKMFKRDAESVGYKL